MRKHIFLLGPPAVGKLTVGRILSDSIGYPLFDNSKSVDIASLLYNYGSQQYRKYRDDLRYNFYEKAATSDIDGLISTLCLRRPENWNYILSIEDILPSKKWETYYFIIKADKKTLIERAQSEDRRQKNSLSSKEEIVNWLNTSPSHSEPVGNDCHIIESTSKAAEEVAKEIANRILL